MRGHSHAKKIKHQKELTDQKKGQVFSKLARLIWVAVKEGGSSPETNSKLRMAIEMAKEARMPGENIERAIKKGTGELASEEKLEQFLFEAYGPGGVAIIIEGITDNKNRALGEVKQILNQNGGKLVGEGAVQWMFDKKGVIEIDIKKYQDKKKEDLEMAAIEAGAEDIYWHQDLFDVYTKPVELEKVKKGLEEKGIEAELVSLDWVAKENVKVDEKDKEACQKLFDALDDSDSVQEIYSNLKE
jgi:YebC/PmpR family DNA-binding regulatory protein